MSEMSVESDWVQLGKLLKAVADLYNTIKCPHCKEVITPVWDSLGIFPAVVWSCPSKYDDGKPNWLSVRPVRLELFI